MNQNTSWNSCQALRSRDLVTFFAILRNTLFHEKRHTALLCQAQACLSDSVVEILHHKDRLVLSLCVPALFSLLNDVHIQALVCFSSVFSIWTASDLRVDTRVSLSSVLFRTLDTSLIAAGMRVLLSSTFSKRNMPGLLYFTVQQDLIFNLVSLCPLH